MVNDLYYVCETIGNLSGIPVRLYAKEKELFFYSMAKLPKDPMKIYKNEIVSIKDTISYFATNNLNYYGILNIADKKIIIGPTRFVPNSQQELHDIAFLTDVLPEEMPAFLAGMKAIVGLPLERLMQMLCLLHYLITGNKIELSQMIIHDSRQELMQRNMISEQMAPVFEKNIFRPGADNTQLTENKLMDMVTAGDIVALNKWLNNPTTVQLGLYATDPIRQLKNTLISTATLASRNAIRGGMEYTDAIRLANDFIYKAELLQSSDELINLQYYVIKTFTEKVNILKYGHTESKLILAVANYIQQNLSSTITVEDIAASLYMSRPYLSKKFKKETGISVSDFIHTQKIEEAKRLLKYTDKSLLSISIYLSYSSQSHFTNMFKKLTGQLPKTYREQSAYQEQKCANTPS